MSRALKFLPLAVIVAAAAKLFSQTKDYGLLGFDSYPIIIASRVQSFADFIGTFTEPLMDGRYASDFYRPLLNLSVAADHAVWGLAPFGYQLTNVLAFAACALALYALARRMAGPGATVVPWAALIIFLLHPTQYDVVPIVPRRAEMLCCLFMALSLYLQLSPAALRSRRPPIWPAVATLLAIASKETGFVLPLVSFVALYAYSDRETLKHRLSHAFVAVVPHLAVVALMAAVRSVVIGLDSGIHASRVLELVTGPSGAQPAMMSSKAGTWVLLGIAVSALTGLATALFSATSENGDAGSSTSRVLRAALVAFAWSVVVLGLTYARGNPWKFSYLFFIPMAGWALLTGAVAGQLVSFARGSGMLFRTASLAMALLVGIPVVRQARFSPLFHHYDEGRRATSASRSFLNETEARIARAVDGTIVSAPDLPRRVPPSDPLRLLGTTILLDYSVQAWADLTIPGRKVRVRFDPQGVGGQPAPDEVLVLLTRPLAGY